MRDIEKVEEPAERYFEVVRSADLLEHDAALAAFDLLTANPYDLISAHALGVSL